MVENWDFVTVACCCGKAAGQLCSCIKFVRNPVCTVPRTGGGLLDFVRTIEPRRDEYGRIAVLARRPAENREVFFDFVASRGREGPPSILATFVVNRK